VFASPAHNLLPGLDAGGIRLVQRLRDDHSDGGTGWRGGTGHEHPASPSCRVVNSSGWPSPWRRGHPAVVVADEPTAELDVATCGGGAGAARLGRRRRDVPRGVRSVVIASATSSSTRGQEGRVTAGATVGVDVGASVVALRRRRRSDTPSPSRPRRTAGNVHRARGPSGRARRRCSRSWPNGARPDAGHQWRRLHRRTTSAGATWPCCPRRSPTPRAGLLESVALPLRLSG
jgi:hypothetical protein